MSTHRSARQAARQSRSAGLRTGHSPYRRTLRHEPLENRRLLAVVTVTTLADTIDFNDGLTSLREAIFATNTVAGADTINFAASLTASGPATIVLTQGELRISDSLAIDGPGADLLTLDASGSDPTPGIGDSKGIRIFNVDEGSASRISASINKLRLTGADAPLGVAGLILSTENLALSDDLIDSNFGRYDLIYSTGVLTIDGNRIINNRLLDRSVGGAMVLATELNVQHSVISGNDGWGISANGKALITDTTISDNLGVGVSLKTNNGQLSGCTVSGNREEGLRFQGNANFVVSDSLISGNGNGGAYCQMFGAGKVTIQGSTFRNNHAPFRGGAVYAHGNLEISDCVFDHNSAPDGGGIARTDGFPSTQLTVQRSIFSDNVATFHGGALFVDLPYANQTVSLAENIIQNNAAQFGGGIAIQHSSGVVSIVQAELCGNKASSVGGGIWMQSGSGSFQLVDSTIDGNYAQQQGGGIYVGSGSVDVHQTTFSGNVSGDSGSAVFFSGATLAIAHSTITGNTSGGTAASAITAFGYRSLRLSNTVVAGNFGPSTAADLQYGFRTGSTVDIAFNLIGNNQGSGLLPTEPGTPDAQGNLVGGSLPGTDINPLLGPLADNGGYTLPDGSHVLTHALLPGSPAIDAGDPAASAGVNGVPFNDQRGAPFSRVYGGRIDIGAFEFQPTSYVLGDFNRDGLVDTSDYMLSRRQLGSTVAAGAGPDANGDGIVNDADYGIWRANFGSSLQLHVLASGATVQPSSVPIASVGDTRLHALAPPMLSINQEQVGVRKSKPKLAIAATPELVAQRDEVIGWITTRLQETRPVGASVELDTAMDAKPRAVESRESLHLAVDEAFTKLGTSR